MELYNFPILIITAVLVVVLYKYYKALNGRIRVFSITSFFCLCYLVYALIGSALMNCMKFEAEENSGIYSHPDDVFSVWLYTAMGIVFLFLGFTLAHYVYGKRFPIKKMQANSSNSPIIKNRYDLSSKNYNWILCLFLFSVAILIIYRHIIGGFPLENIFSGLKGAELALLRSDATNNFSGKLYRYVMFMEVLPMFLFILVSFIKEPNMTKKWKILYFMLMAYNILYALITLQKAPIINFIILCYIIYTFKEREIKKKPLIIVGLLSVVLIVLMYVFFMGVSDETPASEILAGALHRIFISSIMPFYWYIRFTNEHGLLWGLTFPNPAGILPFEHFRLTVEIMNYARGFEGDTVGTMPTVFIGEMYSNFGVIGIILSSIIVGFFLQTLDIFFWRKMSLRKSALWATLFVYLMIHCYHYTISSISGIIIDTSLYFVAFITYWYMRRERHYLNTHNRQKQIPGQLVHAQQLAVIFFPLLMIGCTHSDNDSLYVEENYTGNAEYTVRDSCISANGLHKISTFVTSRSGMGVSVDGQWKRYDDVAVRYYPIISDDGHYAWCQQLSGSGYDVMWNGKSILHSGASLDMLTGGSSTAVCVQADTGQMITRIFLIDMQTGVCSPIVVWRNVFVEEIARIGDDVYGVVASRYDSSGNKIYSMTRFDGKTMAIETIVENEPSMLSFQKCTDSDASFIDFVDCPQNEKYLFHAIREYMKGDAFAFGNDFRGRIAWNESYRLRGLCELYKKTGNAAVKKSCNKIVSGIMNSRNRLTGVPEDEWNPNSLWASKSYSIGNAPVSIIVENCETLSALLYACNEGAVNSREVVTTAKEAFEYYDQWYKDGHYYLPYSFPMSFDGILVPWNWQNAMAEVCLGLYVETGEQKYLTRCNELISTFKAEWVESGDRIYWHYWPVSFYQGWTDDGKSKNTPSLAQQEDNLYEDASHAGISVRLLCRYADVVPNGLVTKEMIRKIEGNMKYFCFADGFSRFISGDDNYVPRAWHYWISPYFSYLHNDEFEKYVSQGYLKCFPSWDSSGALFAYAKMYQSNLSAGGISVKRKLLAPDGTLSDMEEFSLSNADLWSYLGVGNN